jgi:hypothetical protein
MYELAAGDRLETFAGTRIYLASSSGDIYRLDENSAIEVVDVSKSNVMSIAMRKGKLNWGSDLQASRMFDYSAACLDHSAINKWVTDLRRTYRNNDDLAEHIITLKTGKQIFVSSISELLPSGFSIPSGWANTLIQWANEGEMAYAIALAYGHSASSLGFDSFKRDLIFIHAGKNMTLAAINNDLSTAKLSAAQMKALRDAAGTYKIKSVNIPKDAMDLLTRATLQRLAASKNLTFRSVFSFIPIASIISSAVFNGADARIFGDSAKAYYKR